MFGSERAELSHYGYSFGNNEIIITYNAVRVLSFDCKEIGQLSSECGTGGKTMLKKVRAFVEKKLPFLFDDDLQFKVRDIFRLLSDLIVWPVNYIKSFLK